jgi:hypothetical protein
MSEIEIFEREIAVSAEYDVRTLNNGIQVKVRFANGYGLSVVRHSFRYGGRDGMWEAGPILYVTDGFDNWEFVGMSMRLPGFDNDDVRGWLSMEDVDEIAQMVAAL